MKRDFLSVKPGEHFVLLEEVRAAGRIVYNEAMAGWMVAGYDDVKKVLLDRRNFGSEDTPFARSFGSTAMLVQDGPLHDEVRKVWSMPFMARAVEAQRDALVALADPIIDHMAAELEAGRTVDFIAGVEDFVAGVSVKLMGFHSDRRTDFQRWNRNIGTTAIFTLPDDDPDAIARVRSKQELFGLIDSEISARRERSGEKEGGRPSLIDLMVSAEGTGGITRQVVRDNLMNALLGSLNTTVKWIGNSLIAIGRSPLIRSELNRNPELLSDILDEVLRHEGSVQLLVRKSLSDDPEIAGTAIQRGDLIYLLLGAANRDPAVFENPLHFDIARPAKLQLGFGFGKHICLGMNVARLEATIFLRRFLARCPCFEIGSVDYGDIWSTYGPASLGMVSRRMG